MKLSTTPVLGGRPSNNQSKALKWAFRTAKKINLFYWNCHAPRGLIFTASICVRFSLSETECLSSLKTLHTFASTEILFEILSLKVYMGNFKGDKNLYFWVSEIDCLNADWGPLFHQEVETNQDFVIVISLSTNLNGNIIIIPHHPTLYSVSNSIVW